MTHYPGCEFFAALRLMSQIHQTFNSLRAGSMSLIHFFGPFLKRLLLDFPRVDNSTVNQHFQRNL